LNVSSSRHPCALNSVKALVGNVNVNYIYNLQILQVGSIHGLG
jgi:hypothetical protein